jgi:hypothetical protein
LVDKEVMNMAAQQNQLGFYWRQTGNLPVFPDFQGTIQFLSFLSSLPKKKEEWSQEGQRGVRYSYKRLRLKMNFFCYVGRR